MSLDLSHDTPLEQICEGRVISNQHVKVKPQSYNPVFVMCPGGYFTTGYAKTEHGNDENIFVSYNEIIKDGLYGWQFVFENHNDTANEFVGYVDCSVIENPEPLEFFQETNLELMKLEKTRSEVQKQEVRNALTSDSLTDKDKIQIIKDYITEFQNKEPFVDFFLIWLNSQYATDENMGFTIVEWGKSELCDTIRVTFYQVYHGPERQSLIDKIPKNCQYAESEYFVNFHNSSDALIGKRECGWTFPQESKYFIGIENNLPDSERIVGNFNIYSKSD